MTVSHDEEPFTRRELRDLERQKPRKQRNEEVKAAEVAKAKKRAEPELLLSPDNSAKRSVESHHSSAPQPAVTPSLSRRARRAIADHSGEQVADYQGGYKRSGVTDATGPIIAEYVSDESDIPYAATSSAEEEELAEIEDSPAPGAVGVITIDSTSGPILAPPLQAPMEGRRAKAEPLEASPFDDRVSAGGVGSSNSGSTTSALVLPSVPNHSDVGTALDETGEVIITGSINLPISLGSTGAAPADGLESSDLDAYLESEGDIGSDVAPVSATQAVSTHGVSSGLVTPPKRSRANAPVVLAITAGFLAVGVIGLLLAVFIFRVF